MKEDDAFTLRTTICLINNQANFCLLYVSKIKRAS